MQQAVVQGKATSTVKHPSLAGWRLLLCMTLGADRRPAGEPIVVLDRLGAGPGDTVLVTSDGKGLRQLVGDQTSPARWWTVGIVDEPGGG